MPRARFLLPALFLAAPLHAQETGEQLYTLYCSACHGPDGQGATGGQFPPLADSLWVAGDAARSIQIILKGLHGPVQVGNRTYNLEMPPQGGILSDEQISSILTHVRSSWGNKDAAVTPEMVKDQRTASADRTTMWTSEDLLKIHPLPKPPPPIDHLISRVYKGEWLELPDFTKLEPESIEEEHDGLLSLRRTGFTDHFGVVWEGELTTPETGDYSFRADADDGIRILVNGEEIIKIDGIGPMDGSRLVQRTVPLEAGVQKLRVEYFEGTGQESLNVAWRGPGIPDWKLLSDPPRGMGMGRGGRGGPQRDPIPLRPTEDRSVIYRNFIGGTTPRAIGFGFPGGVNIAYSADNLAPELIWTGDFMDASRHWIERGQGNQPPAGERVVKLTGTAILGQDALFGGYQLDAAGNPTFTVRFLGRTLLDSFKPGIHGDQPALIRTLTLEAGSEPVELLVNDQAAAKPLEADQDFDFGPDLLLHVEKGELLPRDGQTFLKLAPGEATTLTYRWK